MKQFASISIAIIIASSTNAQAPELVKDIYNYTNTGSITGGANYTAVGSTVYFTANDCLNGFELWKTDGTEAGTMMVKDISFHSMCEHHFLPFFGKAHVAYIPNNYIVGLSKIPRVVDAFARRLQVQERLTTQIRDAIQETLKPLGVAVVIEAKHMCMQIRGVQKQNSVTTTSAFTGEFENDRTRSEFIRLISSKLS